MSIARELAQRICAMRYEDLPPAAIHCAKICILDTVGVTLAGSREGAARLAERALGPTTGNSLIFGSNRRVNRLDAALVNGTASHAIDFDDSNHAMGGHPSAPIVSALFALADDIGASGRDFLAAYVTGHEVDTKIASGVNFHHYTKGWHPTATLGIFGTTAACARLIKLSEAQTAVAIAIAVSFASGIKANFGTMMKPMHAGHCARNGVFAALLANEGYTANATGAFEHKQGFLNVFNGEDNYDASKILLAWAAPLDIVEHGVVIKRHPCCGSTHAAIDAMLTLARKHNLKPDQVERIDSWIHTRRLAHTDRPDPQSALDAKFSLQYCLARALADHTIMLEHFEGDGFRDAGVRQLMGHIHVAPCTAAQFPDGNPQGAEVKITLRDGTVHAAKVDNRDRLSPELLKDKFVNCALRAGPESSAAQLHGAIENFERIDDVRELTALIEAHAETGPTPTALTASA